MCDGTTVRDDTGMIVFFFHIQFKHIIAKAVAIAAAAEATAKTITTKLIEIRLERKTVIMEKFR